MLMKMTHKQIFGDKKEIVNDDNALTHKVCEFVKTRSGISDNTGDGLNRGFFEVTQGFNSYAHLSDNAFINTRRNR